MTQAKTKKLDLTRRGRSLDHQDLCFIQRIRIGPIGRAVGKKSIYWIPTPEFQEYSNVT